MDPDANNPGPIDASVLHDQENHVSSVIWDGQERGVLRCHEHTSKLGEWRLMPKQIELVEKAGFGYLRLLPSISLDNPLISALVERWRKETNTFHMKVGEMTITLEDVALLLGLAIDGEPVLGATYTSCQSVCEKFLGKVPEAGYISGGMLKLSWLKEYFSQCPEDALTDKIEQHTRAYLLYLVGSTIFSTTTGNKVPIMYLPLFEDFDKAGKYAWGAAALAFLYRALGRATLKTQSTISGSLTLVQCWSYFRLNIGRPKFFQEPVRDCFPLVLWWKGKQSAATLKRDLVFYRKALDSLESDDVEWLPYKNVDGALIPENIKSTLILGRSKTMMICFDKAERHLPDRCLRQYGMLQGIPEDVDQWERKSRGVDSKMNLSEKMELELNEWSARQLHIFPGYDGVDESEYIDWYLRITRKFVGRPVHALTEFQSTVKFRTRKKRMSAGLREIAQIADTLLAEVLDLQFLEPISKIKAIAHECLGGQVGEAVMQLPTPQIEVGKRREKERVRRNTNGKRRRTDDQVQQPTGDEEDLMELLTAEEEDEMQNPTSGEEDQDYICDSDPRVVCPANTEVDKSQAAEVANSQAAEVANSQTAEFDSSQTLVDHSQTKPERKLKKKPKARKKGHKRKGKNDPMQYDAAGEGIQSEVNNAAGEGIQFEVNNAAGEGIQFEVNNAAAEDVQMQLIHADSKDNKAECHGAASKEDKAEPHVADGKDDKAEFHNADIKDDEEDSHNTNSKDDKADSHNVDSKDAKAESDNADGKDDKAETHSVAGKDEKVESHHLANGVGESKLKHATFRLDNSNPSCVAEEHVPPTCAVVEEVIPEASCAAD